MKEKFLRLYETVFDADGNIKPCGRATCAALIEAAMKLDPQPSKTYYGIFDTNSSNYGWMNVSNIKALHDSFL